MTIALDTGLTLLLLLPLIAVVVVIVLFSVIDFVRWLGGTVMGLFD